MKFAISTIIRFTVAGLLFYAAGAKAFSYEHKVLTTQTLFERFTQDRLFLGYLVIAMEMLVAVWLFTGYKAYSAIIAAIIVFSGFTGVIAADMRLVHPVPCGCLGVAVVDANDPEKIAATLRWDMGRNLTVLCALCGLLITHSAATDECKPKERTKGDLASITGHDSFDASR